MLELQYRLANFQPTGSETLSVPAIRQSPLLLGAALVAGGAVVALMGLRVLIGVIGAISLLSQLKRRRREVPPPHPPHDSE
jgi:hypothetical protein